MATALPLTGYARLTENIRAWAQAAPDVRGAVVIGSQARTDHPADEWSDLDVLVFASPPERYAFSADWLAAIGAPVLTFVERAPGGDWERRVLFAGGLDVDFAFNSAQALEYLAHNPLPEAFADIVRRGVRILVDKDGLLAQAQRQPLPANCASLPPEAEFLNVVHDFWYHALWTAKHLRRGEVWWAKCGCDIRLKELLRQMLEWHARAMHGPTHDTWMRGRFLEEWADPRALRALPGLFADYDAADIGRALLATMTLFRWVTLETAARWEYAYPHEGERAVTEHVQRLLAGGA
jgi:aminoglycoside 6-adenylyltransferase